jgi:heptosyltransferase-2
VLAPNWIGDVVMSTPFLSVLRSAHPDDFITVLCREYVSELIVRSPLIDTLATYTRGGGVRGALGALRKVRPAGGWDECFVLPMSFSSALVAFLSGSRRRTGYSSGPRSFLLSAPLDSGGLRSGHLSEEYAALAGKKVDELPCPGVIPPYDWKERTARYGLDGRYAVFAAGATYGPAKVWPRDRFIETAVRLSRDHGLKPVTTGGPSERIYLDMIADKAGGLNLSGKSGAGDLMSVLRGAEVVVGNDSGPVHVSAAMGVPTVAIFGSTSPGWTAPRGRAVRVISSSPDCSPCFERECPLGDTHCLTDIAAGDVVEAAAELMKAGKS